MIGLRAWACGLLAVLGAGAAPVHSAEPVAIGVLAFRGADEARARWMATVDYLDARIADTSFTLMALTLGEMPRAVAGGRLGFVLTNTGNYVDLEARFGISRIATLRTPSRVTAGNVFGAVIFTAAGRDDLSGIKDLKGKRFLAVGPHAFGGFQMAWREMKAAGVDPFEDLAELKFSGFPQDRIAFAVREGLADAGTVRTGTLEALVREGAARMTDFKVLAAKRFKGFPYAVSTRLYPEWAFARVHGTDNDLAQRVAIALLDMPGDGAAAKAGRYGGWTVPLDYQPVHDLFRELRIGPYEELGAITLADLFKQYGPWVVVAVICLLVMAGWATWIEILVARRTRELSTANAELQRQIGERRRAEEEARRRLAELAHVHRLNTLGEMAAGFAHELNQPLAAITNYAKGCVRRLKSGRGEPAELLDAMEQVAQQAGRAAQVIRRIRGFVRKEAPKRAAADINHVIGETVNLVRVDLERQGITVTLDLADGLAPVPVDVVQIEQVVLNLLRNGVEAMNEAPPAKRTLGIRTRPHGEDAVEVTVTDNGPGVAALGQGSVFDPFVTSKPDGLGLGLSISKSIVENHGGRLRVAAGASGGAQMSFTLPTARAGAEPRRGAA